MIEIKKITVFKNGFFTRTSDLESKGSNPLIKPYLVVFNQLANDGLAHFIAEYTRGKGKGKSSRCPEKYLINCYEKDVNLYRKVCRSLWYDLTQRKKRLGPETGFIIYRIKEDKTAGTIDDIDARKSFIKAFIHREEDEDDSEFYLWLGDYEKTIKFKTGKSVSEYGVTPPKDKNKLAPEKPSCDNEPISDENNKLHPWFIKRTENLGLKELREVKGFDIYEADKNSDYIKRKDVKIDGRLSRYVQDGKDILVSGPPGVGKTRYAYNELKNLPGYYIFSFPEYAITQSSSIDFSENFKALKGEKLIWFIDDMHYFSGEEKFLGEFYQKLITVFGRIVVVATIRSDLDKNNQSRIRKNMHPLKMGTWSDKDMENLAIYYGYDIDKLTGAPLYLFKNIDKLKELFEKYQKKEKNCVWLMRYLKLLNEFYQYIDYKLIKETYLYLRKEKQGVDDFESAFIALKQAGFIEKKEKYVKTWDLILEEVVVKDDYSDFDKHMENLIPFFSRLKEFKKLFKLGIYFAVNMVFNNAILCFKEITENIDNIKSTMLVSFSYSNWGSSLGNLEKYEDACEKYEKAIEVFPENTFANFNWGDSLANLGKYEEAFSKYKKAIEINPEYPETYINCGATLANLGKYEEACEKYEKAIEIDPECAHAYFNWGNSLITLGKYEEACEKYEKATKYDDEDSPSYFNWGNALVDLGNLNDDPKKFEEACEKYEKGIEIDSKNVNSYYSWGAILANLEEFEESIKKYEKAIEIDPECAHAYFNWGNSLIALGKYEEACKKFEKAVEIDPEYSEAYNNLAYSLTILEKYEDACLKFEEAYIINPEYITYYYWGSALANLGKLEEACEKYEKAIEIDPECAETYFSWGAALANLRKYEEACEKYEKGIEIDPEYSDAYNSLGIVLGNLKKYEDACLKFEEAVGIDPECDRAYYGWGIALGDLGKYEEACKKFEKAVEIDPECAEAYYGWGIALAKLGKYAEAIEKNKKAVDIDPECAKVHLNLGTLFKICKNLPRLIWHVFRRKNKY